MEYIIYNLWQVWILFGIIFIIIEIMTPTMFFLNLAFAAFVTSIFAYFKMPLIWEVILFGVISIFGIYFLVPYLKKSNKTVQKTGIEEKYIGKCAKVIEEINEFNGAITIYGERWIARSKNSENIDVGEEVKILKIDGSVFIVEKI